MSSRRNCLSGAVAVIALLSSNVTVEAQTGERQAPPRPVVREALQFDTTPPLRGMPPISPAPGVVLNVREMPRKMLPNREDSIDIGGPDTVVQEAPGGTAAPSTSSSFDGVNNVDGVLPPDPTGAIGPGHYVQMVNLSFAVYDRAGNKLYGPVDNSTLWQGSGVCGTNNDGDPIVLYDHLADRWVMSQFALPNFPFGPFYQCIAVSETGDPLESWYRYTFLISNSKMNDYPKLGVWPDGYYMSVNQFNQGSLGWAGAGVVAFERNKMLAGQTARMVYFDLYSTDPNLGGMLPADLDGPAPAAGTPNPFAQIDDNAWGYSPDQIQIWNFGVSWGPTASASFSLAKKLNTASFDANMCRYRRNCIPQPGGTRVDAISDRAMFRLQYRAGAPQTMVLNHTVDVGGDHAGIRWYELRDTGSGWNIYQQGTYAPDSDHRWMGSIAMNKSGDIALGYSISSSTKYPSVFFTGRLDGDPFGQMTQGEGVIVNGSGYQTHSSGRWGDYSHLSVDPMDDCTFWYTQEYYATTGSAPWRTRIGSFKLRECGSGGNTPPVASFTFSCSGLMCNFDGSGSSDPDGNIVSYAWDFGDGVSGSGVNPSHTYAAGTYTVSLTVTDNQGATGTTSQNVNVNESTGGTAHVGDLDGSATTAGKNWKATVVITVHDGGHGPLAGAAVTGTWSGGYSGTGSCTTNAAGQCSVTTGVIKNASSVTFSVTGLAKSGYTYDSGSNEATSITVSRP